MSYVIGITGGIGSGKSTVLDILKNRFNANVIEADKVGHSVMEVGNAAYTKIVEEFGKDILDDNGNIVRSRLSELVFNDESRLIKLNSIIHPAVKDAIVEFINKSKADNIMYIVIEAALLIEAGYRDICDTFWYVYADENTRISRLMNNRGYDKDKCIAIMNNQLSDKMFRENCDVIIDNSSDVENLIKQISNALDFM